MEGTSIEETLQALTCPAADRGQAAGSGSARRDQDRALAKGCQRRSIDRGPVSRKSAGALARGTHRVQVLVSTSAASGVDRTEAGGRAVKHAAAGGRMTARWSGVEARTETAATPPCRCSICLANVRAEVAERWLLPGSKLDAGGVTHGTRVAVSRGGVDSECS
jgi:hypothetical protein